ncbi:MAG: hypothetical protein A4S17_01085 [Proteobacteria bacterium HN_bin10]|jgi:hypothetical protein|nr:MAG: hypothetical protein A4S17_01085 [Proteobacteria bacterium HN_bin10]
MRRAAALFFLLGLTPACAGSAPPPAELGGLWSAGAAACEAGVGVRFGAEAIEVVYQDERQVLFERPRYRLESSGRTFRVRIVYDLPRVAGGARVAGAHGVVVLARQPDGGVAPMTHSIVDGRTGSARLRLADDPAVTALTLTPCGDHPWTQDIRGRA